MKDFIIKHAEVAAELLAFGILKHKFEKLEEHHDEKEMANELVCFYEILGEYIAAKGIEIPSKK